LFQQPTVRAQRWTRITSEEEERVREGYFTTTHFRTGGGTARESRILTELETGNPFGDIPASSPAVAHQSWLAKVI